MVEARGIHTAERVSDAAIIFGALKSLIERG
jgi:hypothetical protein